jgi:hypothetical protein
MRFDGRGYARRFQVAFGSKNDTVNTKAQPLGQAKALVCGVRLGIVNQVFFHESGNK